MWIKFHLALLDDDITELPYEAQLLFDRLLLVAGKTSNVLRDDAEWLAKQTRMDTRTITKHLPSLVKGAWLTRTRASKVLVSGYPVASPRARGLAVAREEKENINPKAVSALRVERDGLGFTISRDLLKEMPHGS